MSIELKARDFAIKAHDGQVRKSDPVKLKIVYPINVAQILKKYGFDETVTDCHSLKFRINI